MRNIFLIRRNSVLCFLFILCITFKQLYASAEVSKDHKIKVRVSRSPTSNKPPGLIEDEPEPEITTPKNNGTEAKNGFLLLPPGYNKLLIPLLNASDEIFVMVHLSIREILDVDTDNEIIALDTEIIITWMDWKIWKYFIEDEEAQKQVENGQEEIILDSEFLKQIWKPDIFIEEMDSIERTSILDKLINLRFLVKNKIMPGAITLKSRQTFKVRCDMDFQYYPADTQTCSINIRSYSYTQERLFLLWSPSQSVYLDQTEDSNYNFQISNVEPGENLYDRFTLSQSKCCGHTNYSTLSVTLKIRRTLTYHFVQTCLPSILLILVTWLCFLLPPDMVEVRIGISMTTLLTLTAMFSSVREQSPKVSYTMAIDFWMVFCMFLLFLALALFTFIYWLRRKATETSEEIDSETPSEAIVYSNGVKHNSNGTSRKKKYRQLANNIKKYSFWLFAFVFFTFIIVFTIWILTLSEYLNWDPSEKYNALPLEDEDGNENDTNRLFAIKDAEFKPHNIKKIPESTYRFRDIFNKKVFPKLNELERMRNGGVEEEYYDESIETTTASEDITDPTV